MTSRILIVEDEEDMRHFIADVLKEAGYHVAVPVDSYVALDLALGDPYGLITLDTRMPLVDGGAFARTLRAHQVPTPVILVADALDDQQRATFEELGAVDVIVKPFQVDRLVQSVQKHLPLHTE